MRVGIVRMSSIADNIGLVSRSVSKAYQDAGAARALHPTRLVAVSKTKPKEAIIGLTKQDTGCLGRTMYRNLLRSPRTR